MKKSVAKGAAYLAFSQLLFMISGYLTNIVLGRHFGPSLYGIYGVLTSLMTALNIMQVSGVPQAVSRFSAEKRENASAVLKSGFQIQLIITVAIGLVFYLSAPTIANLFNEHRFVGYSRAVSLIFPIYGIFALFAGYYNGLHRFKRQALMNSVYSISKLILVIVLALKFGLFGAIVGFVLSPLIALFFGFKFPRSNISFSRRILIFYSLPLIGFAVLAALQLSIDLFSLKALVHDTKIAGYYTAAQNIALIPYLSMSAIGQVLFPSVSKFVSSGKKDEVSKLLSQSLRYLILMLAPIVTLIVVTAPKLILFLFGIKYLPAVQPLRILLFGYGLLTFFAMLTNVLNGAGFAKKSMLIATLGTTTGLIGCLILIPHYGANGGAIGTLLGATLVAIWSLASTHKAFPFYIPYMSVMRVLIGSAVVFIGGWIISIPVILLPLLYILLLFIYFLVLCIIGEITVNDRTHIKNLLPAWLPLVGRL